MVFSLIIYRMVSDKGRFHYNPNYLSRITFIYLRLFSQPSALVRARYTTVRKTSCFRYFFRRLRSNAPTKKCLTWKSVDSGFSKFSVGDPATRKWELNWPSRAYARRSMDHGYYYDSVIFCLISLKRQVAVTVAFPLYHWAVHERYEYSFGWLGEMVNRHVHRRQFGHFKTGGQTAFLPTSILCPSFSVLFRFPSLQCHHSALGATSSQTRLSLCSNRQVLLQFREKKNELWWDSGFITLAKSTRRRCFGQTAFWKYTNYPKYIMFVTRSTAL